MKKLKLDIDELTVESFAAVQEDGEKGTVAGLETLDLSHCHTHCGDCPTDEVRCSDENPCANLE